MAEKPFKRVTLKDIAEHVGITAATVSMALKNSPKISRAMKEQVQEAADELGYLPDPLLSHLMAARRSGKTATGFQQIAWLTQHSEEDGWRESSSILKFYNGALERAQALGYKLEPYWLKAPGMTASRMRQILLTRNVNAIVLPSMPYMNATMEFPFDDFCVVAIGQSICSPMLNRVVPDFHAGSKVLFQQAKARGYRRIGLLIREDSHDHLNDPLEAYYYLFLEKNPEQERIPVFYYSKDNYANLQQWRRTHKPDVLISVHADPTRLNKLRQGKCKRPDILWLNHPSSKAKHLSGMDIQAEQVGARAVDFVTALLNQNNRGVGKNTVTIQTPMHWLEGETVRSVLKETSTPQAEH